MYFKNIHEIVLIFLQVLILTLLSICAFRNKYKWFSFFAFYDGKIFNLILHDEKNKRNLTIFKFFVLINQTIKKFMKSKHISTYSIGKIDNKVENCLNLKTIFQKFNDNCGLKIVYLTKVCEKNLISLNEIEIKKIYFFEFIISLRAFFIKNFILSENGTIDDKKFIYKKKIHYSYLIKKSNLREIIKYSIDPEKKCIKNNNRVNFYLNNTIVSLKKLFDLNDFIYFTRILFKKKYFDSMKKIYLFKYFPKYFDKELCFFLKNNKIHNYKKHLIFRKYKNDVSCIINLLIKIPFKPLVYMKMLWKFEKIIWFFIEIRKVSFVIDKKSYEYLRYNGGNLISEQKNVRYFFFKYLKFYIHLNNYFKKIITDTTMKLEYIKKFIFKKKTIKSSDFCCFMFYRFQFFFTNDFISLSFSKLTSKILLDFYNILNLVENAVFIHLFFQKKNLSKFQNEKTNPLCMFSMLIDNYFEQNVSKFFFNFKYIKYLNLIFSADYFSYFDKKNLS